jgi:DNA-binding transcriptional ArsR family regulator
MNGNGTRQRLEEEVYERQVGICKAFANPTRLRLLDMVARRDYSASELQASLSISKANLSQHLAILKAAGVVVTHRNGKHVHCHLAIPEVKKACSLIREVLRAQIRSGRNLAV